MITKGVKAGEKIKLSLSDLTLEQLNWKPAEDWWSIGQCLDHLVVSDCLYFPALKMVTEGKHDMNFWENWNPFSGLFGKMLVNQINEMPKKKLKSPVIFSPSYNNIDLGILDRFHKHLDTLLEYIAACNRVDIDKVHITSPVSKVVTYSLRMAITILIQHEHRHINQALKIKTAKDFPQL